jgi:hypothetical protein
MICSVVAQVWGSFNVTSEFMNRFDNRALHT